MADAFCTNGTNYLEINWLRDPAAPNAPGWQERLFDNPAKRKITPKGRRSGLTHGYGNMCIRHLLNGDSPILWGDTVHGNIDRYVERYFIAPTLSRVNPKYWQWRQQKKELAICGKVCDFRSADQPETWEGFGYKVMFLNEAGIILRNRALWESTILPMTMDYDPIMYIGGVPKGKKSRSDGKSHVFYDLSQQAQSEMLAGNPRWLHATYTYRDNSKLSPEGIAELLSTISGNAREQEIEGKFIDASVNAIFKREWWKFCDKMPDDIIRVSQSWDTAFKDDETNDWSVCTTWAEMPGYLILMDVLRRRLTYPDLLAVMKSQAEIYNPYEILIEDKASGQSLIQSARRETNLRIKAIKTVNDKVARANSCSHLPEQGKVILLKGQWNEPFISELEDFPDGEFDDQVDSTTQKLNDFIKRRKTTETYGVSRYDL